jgi:4-hydroxybenzoate polyprenyltransferase
VGRWSLFVAVALAAATVWGYFAAAESFGTPLPYAVGILFLGLSWWRAGVATADRVPDQPKSLAE